MRGVCTIYVCIDSDYSMLEGRLFVRSRTQTGGRRTTEGYSIGDVTQSIVEVGANPLFKWNGKLFFVHRVFLLYKTHSIYMSSRSTACRPSC